MGGHFHVSHHFTDVHLGLFYIVLSLMPIHEYYEALWIGEGCLESITLNIIPRSAETLS